MNERVHGCMRICCGLQLNKVIGVIREVWFTNFKRYHTTAFKTNTHELVRVNDDDLCKCFKPIKLKN